MWVMATVLYSHYFRPDQTAKAMGAMQFNTVSTQFFCMAISGYLIHLFGWDFPFWLGAIASLIGLYFAWNIKEIHVENQHAAGLTVIDYIKQTRAIAGLNLITLLSLVAHAVLFITIFGLDRKSTRLNSSHVAISYPVFCL